MFFFVDTKSKTIKEEITFGCLVHQVVKIKLLFIRFDLRLCSQLLLLFCLVKDFSLFGEIWSSVDADNYFQFSQSHESELKFRPSILWSQFYQTSFLLAFDLILIGLSIFINKNKFTFFTMTILKGEKKRQIMHLQRKKLGSIGCW